MTLTQFGLDVLYFVASIRADRWCNVVTPGIMSLLSFAVYAIQMTNPTACIVPAEFTGHREAFIKTKCTLLSPKFTVSPTNVFIPVPASPAKQLSYIYIILAVTLVAPIAFWWQLQKGKCSKNIKDGADIKENIFNKCKAIAKDQNKNQDDKIEEISSIMSKNKEQLKGHTVLYYVVAKAMTVVVLATQVFWLRSFFGEDNLLEALNPIFNTNTIDNSLIFPVHTFCNVTYYELANTHSTMIECHNKANNILRIVFVASWLWLSWMLIVALTQILGVIVLYFPMAKTFFKANGMETDTVGAGGIHLWIVLEEDFGRNFIVVLFDEFIWKNNREKKQQ
uniref:Innexin n=1 Tax=Panagrellus redivivus TaxID=6233 RepID=A0A7E4VI36_PANRE